MPTGPVRRSRWAFWRVPVEQVVDDELAFHIEMQTRRYVEGGMAPEAARARALRRFGDVDRVRDECRTLGTEREAETRRAEWLGTVSQDARHALRLLRRAPGFAAVAVLTLALGVGASTALFSVVNAALLRALPYAHADRVVMLWNASADGPEFAVSPPEFADVTEQARAFDATAALADRWVNLTGGGQEPERVVSYRVSPNLFDLLGVRPRLGRAFGGADGKAGSAEVVVLSDALWRRRFGGDPAAVGRPIEVNGVMHTVVGVMPPEVRFPDEPLGFLKARAELWVARDFLRDRGEERGSQYLGVVARLRPGATPATARAALDAVGARFRAEWPDRYGGDRRWRIAAVPLREQMVGQARRGLLVLLGAVGLVLLIGCANVANLLLARGAARRRELGVRAALGAGRGRIARQLLTESVVLAGAGGALGVALAWLGVRALAAAGPAGVPRLDAARVDGVVLGFALGVSVLTALAFGLLPAAQQAAVDAAATLRGGGRGAVGGGGARRGLRAALVAGEVALALVVLVGAGLLLRSFGALRAADGGFAPAGAAAMQLALPRTVYDSAYKLAAFHTELQRRVAALPGVRQASAVYPLPMSGEGWGGSFYVEGRPVPPGTSEPHAELAVSMPGYFSAMGIPLRAGRDFGPADRRGAPRVVIVDEELARRYWPGESAVGKRVSFDPEAGFPWMTVVGVVGHVRNAGPRDAGGPQLYMSYLQQPQGPMFVVARTDRDPAGLALALRGTVRAIDARLPVGRLQPMPEVVERVVARERFQLLVLGGFAALALALAAVGLYGVTAYLVSQRSAEMGLRLALGGRPRDVTRLVVSEGLVVTAAGLAAGLVAAAALARVMGNLLFGVRPTDPPTYAGIAALLLAVSLLACWLPARRAARTDPARSLRA